MAGQGGPVAAGGDELDAVIAAVGALPADAAGQPDPVLADRMHRLVQARAMLDAVLVEQVAAFDARAGARVDGQTSTQAWLRSRLRLGGDAAGLVRVARQLADLPQLAKAFAAGEVPLEHASAVAQLAGAVGAGPVADYQPALLELARAAEPGKLRVACAHLRQLLDPDADQDEAARQRRGRYLAAARTVDGMVHLQGLLDPATGQSVLTALAAAMPVPAAYEERTPGQRRADALGEVCRQFLASGQAPRGGGLPPQVNVTVSLATLQQPWPEQPAPPPVLGDVPVLAGGQPVTAATARRLACDAGVIPVVLGADSEPLDIGRHSRVVPAGLRRALVLRDGGCRFAGCDRPPGWCDAHHIEHWADGGPTSLANLVLLCAHHHSLVHEGWRLSGDPAGTLSFHRPDHTRLDLTSQPRCRPPTPATRGP
jgi:hypothetical protein